MKFQNTRIVRKTPTVSANVAYSAGDVVGGTQQFDGIGSHNGSGGVAAVSIVDLDNQKAALTILFFEGAVTGTYTDNGVFTPSAADLTNFLGKVEIAAADYTTLNSKAYASKSFAPPLPIRSKIENDPAAAGGKVDRRITAIAATSGTPTYTTTASLVFVFGLLLD